jgi:hypothetical protein
MATLSVSFDCPECGTTHEFEVTPERPAPFCQNHDSPAFSDPGDPGEVDGPECCEKCGHSFENDWDMIEEKACDEHQDNDCDYAEDAIPTDWEEKPEPQYKTPEAVEQAIRSILLY